MSLHEMTPAEIAWYEAEHGHKVGEFLPMYPDPRAGDETLRCPSCLTREIAHLTPMAMEAEALREKLRDLRRQLDEARAERRCAEAAFVSAAVRYVMRDFDEGHIIVPTKSRAERGEGE